MIQAIVPELIHNPQHLPALEKEGAARSSALFSKAVWERPADPTRVIYSSQLLHGLLEQNIVTGESSTVRITVTETLYDKFGQQVPLVPMGSQILGTVDGTARPGQTRVGMHITKVELPDGTDLTFTGKAGDAGGAVGIPGKVDNKYGQIAIAAVLSATLSVGSRAIAGNTTGFNPTLEQEFAADVSRSVNQTGQDVVKRSLSIQPEISVAAQAPVTVQLSQNISLQTPPVIIHK